MISTRFFFLQREWEPDVAVELECDPTGWASADDKVGNTEDSLT